MTLHPLLPAIGLALAAGQASGSQGVGYVIDATIGTGPAIAARTKITLPRRVLGGRDAVQLSFTASGRTRLLVSTLAVGGQPSVARWTPDSTAADVMVGRGSDPVILTVEYRLPLDSARHAPLGYYLFGATGAEDAWYPTVPGLVEADRRFIAFDVTVEAPRDFALLTSGITADSSRTATAVRRRFRAADVEGFTLAAGRGFSITTAERGGFRAVALSAPAQAAAFRRITEAAADAAAWYRETYGFFPVDQIGIIPGYTGARGGYPLPNVFMIHRGDLSPSFVRWITAHELAHYYWGLYVLDARERLGWLMLALGIWTDQLYLARSGGIALEEAWRDPRGDNSIGEFAQAMIAGYDQRLDLAPEAADSLPYDYNSLVRHGKAAVGVYLLSLQLGADRFLALQKRLLADFRHRGLSPEEFAARVEAAGVPNGGAFLRAWTRGDARVDFAVRSIRRDEADRSAWWLQIHRTGTIPYPVTVEARSNSAAGVRATVTGDAERDSVRVRLTGEPVEVLLDPDGVLPSWNSSHRGMRQTFLAAFGRVGPVGPFLDLARAHLERDPDPGVAALAVERLFELGRWRDVIEYGERFAELRACAWRVTCEAAIQVARAYAKLGDVAAARALLRELEPGLADYGSSTARRAAVARRELEPH